jgi:hypothetical protein
MVGQIVFGSSKSYSNLLGYVALAIEATLPLPQILQNQRRRCCKGFRVSVLANWLVGDCFKMVFFFAKGQSDVPWAFKLCGVFQACCDAYLGIQYYMFGDGEIEMNNGPAAKGGFYEPTEEREMDWVGNGKS